jgi:hypothetical protein
MGLDDFTGERESEAERQRVKELSRNQPPANSKWRHYEPDEPNWVSFINSEVVDDGQRLEGLEYGADDLGGEQALCINLDGVKSSTIRATKYIELGEFI